MTKNRIESFAKYAGIATVSIEWFALFLYYLQMPSYFDGKYPISYFATLPQTQLIFNICYTLAAISFWIFIRHHVSKYYSMPTKLIGVSMILFVGIALVPFNPNNSGSYIIHSTLAYSSGIFFLAAIYIFAKRTNNRNVYRASILASVLSLMLILAFAISPKNSHLIFAFEAGAWLVWQLWILWISYYIHKNYLSKNKKNVRDNIKI